MLRFEVSLAVSVRIWLASARSLRILLAVRGVEIPELLRSPYFGVVRDVSETFKDGVGAG